MYNSYSIIAVTCVASYPGDDVESELEPRWLWIADVECHLDDLVELLACMGRVSAWASSGGLSLAGPAMERYRGVTSFGSQRPSWFTIGKKCPRVEEAVDDQPWYHNIKEYLEKGVYPLGETENDKRILRRLTVGSFLSKTILYKRSADWMLLRCVDVQEAKGIMEEVHEGTFSTHTNGHALACKILKVGYYWTKMELDYCQHPKASNGHRFILVAIDYFTKWVKVASYASVTKSIVVKFLKRDIICRYGLLAHIIIDNGTNLNNKMMTELCEQFKIKYHNFTPYRSKMNGAVEVVNKKHKENSAKNGGDI
ncbi:Pol polyprotein, partial [Mucuna pruriens]